MEYDASLLMNEIIEMTSIYENHGIDSGALMEMLLR